MSKIKTPDWILKGSRKKLEKKKEKKFTIKICPKCRSRDVGVVIGGAVGMWECHKCKFISSIFPEIELSEEEFVRFLENEEKEKK